MTYPSTHSLARRRSAVAGFCILLALSGAGLRAQEKPPSLIAGRVLEQGTGAPIEDAIVYIASTAVGVSTSADGSFRIAGLPPGTYEFVASRVGYERATRTVTIRDAKPVALEFHLAPRFVETGGVDVTTDAETRPAPPPEYFFPTAGTSQYAVFPSASARPIGVLFTDSAFYMYTLDVVVLDSELFIQLWLLYQNLSEHARLIDCQRELALRADAVDGRTVRGISPVPPPAARELKSAADAERAIMAAIGGALDALEDYQVRIRPGYLHTTGESLDAAGGNTDDVSGVMIVRRDAAQALAAASLTSAYLSAAFHESHHAGILGRFTVSPKASVDGFVYFPAPGIAWGAPDAAALRRARSSRYAVDFMTPVGARTVVFHAN